MDRRKSLKALALGTLSAGVLLEACNDGDVDKKAAEDKAKAGAPASTIDRMKEEEAHYKAVTANTFFTPQEMATITILGDIIIPQR